MLYYIYLSPARSLSLGRFVWRQEVYVVGTDCKSAPVQLTSSSELRPAFNTNSFGGLTHTRSGALFLSRSLSLTHSHTHTRSPCLSLSFALSSTLADTLSLSLSRSRSLSLSLQVRVEAGGVRGGHGLQEYAPKP